MFWRVHVDLNQLTAVCHIGMERKLNESNTVRLSAVKVCDIVIHFHSFTLLHNCHIDNNK